MATNKNTSGDEIDLIELFRKLGKKTGDFFRWMVRFVLLIIVFFIRNSYIIIGFLIVGGIIGYGKYKLSKEYYSSEMIVQPNAISTSDFAAYVNSLHDLAKDAHSSMDYSTLSKILQVNDSTAISIKDIQAYLIIDMRKHSGGYLVDYQRNFDLQKDTLNTLSKRADVKVEVYDYHAFEKIKKGLYHYFESDPYLNQLNENRKTRLKELISKTTVQINKLDSLENVLYFEQNIIPQYKSGQIVFLNQPEVKLLHPDLLELFKQRQSYKRELEIYKDPITVIKDFTPITKIENTPSKSILLFGVIFGALSILIMFYWEQRKNIKDLIEKG